MEQHTVVSPQEWVAARQALLKKEKELTHQRDELSKQRQALPWVKVEKSYIFGGPNGKVTLSDLFEGKSQLIVYHFMFGPEWPEGCPGCSFMADSVDGGLVHLKQKDVNWVAISRAPMASIEAFQKRMGWGFQWVSSLHSDFNFDYHVSFTKDELANDKVYYNFEQAPPRGEELPGASVFYKDDAGNIFHTYSVFARGLEPFLGTYGFLDMTPKGRDESATNDMRGWLRHHDKYERVAVHAACCHAEAK